jgi:hypothetical protein
MQFNNPPLFNRRGLMLDISRNRVPTMDCLKRLIDALAVLRYNEVQLYTEHTFAYKDHEDVWKNASPMTVEEIFEIDAYCAERGIELIPNQNSFGHMERWLQHPPYHHLAESPEGFIHPISGEQKHPSTLHPCPESLKFVDQLYSELLPNFQSKQVHVGGDEPWELGKGRSKQLANQVGKHRVYLDYMKGVFKIAEKHGRSPQFWADIIMERPDLVPELPDNVVPVIWGYEADSPFAEQCKIVAGAGFRNQFYVAPGAGNWNSFSGRLDVARANIELAAKEGYANGAKGLLLTAWGDNGHHQSWPSLYPSIVLAAAVMHAENLSESELAKAIDQTFFQESLSGNGEAILQLGKIDRMLPQPAPPNSFLQSAFFADDEALLKLLNQTTSAQLKSCLNALDQIALEGLDPELGLSADLNRSALERCLGIEPSKTRDILANEFAKQWKRHSREGGLSDSLARMGA